MSTIDHFSRGRDAYTQGKPCFCDDARISGVSRQAWYNGWRHQQNLNSSPALRENLDQAIHSIDQILTTLRNS